MTEADLRNRFNFGAPQPWGTAASTGSPGSSDSSSQRLPGSFIPEEPVVEPLPPENASPEVAHEVPQNPDKTCRICLAGAEDGTTIYDLL